MFLSLSIFNFGRTLCGFTCDNREEQDDEATSAPKSLKGFRDFLLD
jgi:hypothetical protein